ncbi:hypothetical protein LEMLEM_LOCUS7203, partial [Lemmus lemmus]
MAVVYCTNNLEEDVLGLSLLKRATLLNVSDQIAMSSKLQHHIGVVFALNDVEELYYVRVVQIFHDAHLSPILEVIPLTIRKDFNCDFRICEEMVTQLHLSKGPFAEGIEYGIVICEGLLFIGAGIQMHD